MYLLRRIVLLLVPALWLLGLELIKKNYDWLTAVAVVFFAYLVFAVWVICKSKFDKVFFHFLILPIFFSAAGMVFLLFSTQDFTYHAVAVLGAAALYLLLRQYLIYFNFPFKYQPYSLESLTFYISLLLVYFLFSSGFAGMTLLKLNFGFLLLVIVPILGLVCYQFFWIHKINFDKSWLLGLIILIIEVELLLAVSYLPTSYYVNAFILTVGSYLMLGLGKLFLLGALNKKNLTGYLFVGAISLIIILLTAQWT